MFVRRFLVSQRGTHIRHLNLRQKSSLRTYEADTDPNYKLIEDHLRLLSSQLAREQSLVTAEQERLYKNWREMTCPVTKQEFEKKYLKEIQDKASRLYNEPDNMLIIITRMETTCKNTWYIVQLLCVINVFIVYCLVGSPAQHDSGTPVVSSNLSKGTPLKYETVILQEYS